MLELWQAEWCPYSHRVRMRLTELQIDWVARTIPLDRAERDAMESALRDHFPEGARWTTPEGGYFYWVDLPETVDTAALLPQATEAGVPYVKGADFCSAGRGRSSLRLAFSAVSPDQIEEGIARLGGVLTRALAPAGV